jgi:RNAse (barnase) inhibitor barstar
VIRRFDWDQVFATDAGWAHLLVCTESEADELVLERQYAMRAEPPRESIWFLRGRRCGTKSRLFQECAAALQFPWYFGENWDALNDCLTDFPWLPSQRYALVLTRTESVLEQDERSFATMVGVFASAAEYWLAPSDQASMPDPVGAASFRVIFQCDDEDATEVRRRLRSAGLSTMLEWSAG